MFFLRAGLRQFRRLLALELEVDEVVVWADVMTSAFWGVVELGALLGWLDGVMEVAGVDVEAGGMLLALWLLVMVDRDEGDSLWLLRSQ